MRFLFGLTILLLVVAPVTASAQYSVLPSVLGNMAGRMAAENYCAPLSDEAAAEVRGPAIASIQGYFAAAKEGGKKSSAFKIGKRTRWKLGTASVGASELDQQPDPLATPGNNLNPDPLRLFRARNLRTTLGQWAVRDAGGGVVGVYTGLLEREKREWKLLELTVHQANDVVEPIADFCETPGDTSKTRITSLLENVARLEEKTAKQEKKVADLEAKSASKGGAAALTQRSTFLQEKENLDQTKEALKSAREAHSKAVADFAMIQSLTVPAREAERFRIRVVRWLN